MTEEGQTVNNNPKKRNNRKWARRGLLLLLSPVLLVLTLSVLLYVPFIQDFAVRQASSIASEATGMTIQIQKIRLSFPLDLTIRQAQAIRQPGDTLLALADLRVRIHALPLLKRQVMVEAIELNGLQANTGDLIDGLEIKGSLGHLFLKMDRAYLPDELAVLNEATLSDAAITLIIRETEPKPETPSEPVNWKLRLEKVRLEQVALALQMPDDSLRLTTYIPNSQLDNGSVDLGNLSYGAERFTISNTTLTYDTGYAAPAANGLDPSHIAIDSLNVALDSLYYQDKTIRANLTRWTLSERSGLRIKELKGKIDSDPTTIRVPELILRTAYSEAGLTAEIPWSSIDTKASGQMTAQLSAAIGPQDLFALAGDAIPTELKPHYPPQPLEMAVGINGNLETLVLNKANATIGGVLDLRLDGRAEALTDSLRRLADLRVDLRLGDLDFLKSLLPAEQRALYQIPRGITLKGNVGMAGTEYRTRLSLNEGRSTIAASGRYDIATQRYEASLSIDSLEPTHFMPHDSLYWVAGKIQAEGQGTDPFSPRTTMRLDGNIYDIRYGASSLADIRIGSTLKEHFLNLELISDYPLARMEINLNADVREERLKAMLIVDTEHLDLHQMHLTSMPLSSSFQIFAEAESDLKEDHLLDVTLGNWELVSDKGRFKPKTLTLHTRSTADTSRVSFHAGDLSVTMSGDKGINGLLEDFNKLSTSVDQQLKQDSTINLAALRPLLPHLSLEVGIGQDNPVSNYLKSYEILFDQLDLYAETSPENGLSLRSSLNKLAKDTLLIDSIRTTITQDSLGLNYLVRVAKGPYRRQKPFTAGLEGKIRLDYADALFHFQNETADTSFLIGIQMNKMAEGFRFHLFPETPIIALRPFQINKDNYVDFYTSRNIHANLRLTGEQDASLWLYSTEVADTLAELHAELSHVDLANLARSINLPDIAGTLSADLQYLPSDTSFIAVSNLFIDELFYEKERVGELMANAVYLPLARDEHQADLHLFRDEREIASVSALYTAGDEERIQGALSLYHLPLAMADPFIPEDMAKLHGDLDGSLTISGNSQAPILDGFLALDSVSVYVGAVGSTFRFDNKNVEIKSNRLTFDKYGIYSSGKNPFIIDGTIDFNQMDNPMANLRLTANNLELLNTKKKPESLVYGKLYVNLNSTLTGPLNLLKMRGDLQLLGGTDITYILKDSPLTVQDRLADMVTFTSFADTLYHETTRKPPLPLGGMDMLMTIRIDPVVQANVDLSEDQSSHINLIGGGDLSFQYTPQGDMILNGQYTLSGGTIKYAMPVIPLKEFSIQNGSYLLWNGNPMDPLLNLTATERVRTSVSSNGQSPRMVNFDVGIEIQQRLENLGLNFTLTAPEDLSMQEELTAKGSEERAKLAVSMLVTGLYLGSTTGSNGKVNLDMGDALNSFLQSEINNIAGSALKTVDISFGMDTYDDNVNGVAGSRTDYSFRFAKRFYNDRIQVILGGRISTGENINNGQAQPFIDNVSVEYRLDNSGSRYVKLFHNKNYESLLEGEITETGAGIVLRRKMMHLRELFNFKKKKVKPINEEEKEE